MYPIHPFKSFRTKIKDFRSFERGVDYFIDFSESYETACMSTALKIKVGDQIILPCRKLILTYYVEAIDYYWNDDFIRIVLLKKLSEIYS